MKVYFKLFCLSIVLIAVSAKIDKSILLDQYMDSPKELFKAYYTLYEKSSEYDINTEEGVRKYMIFKKNVNWIKEENSRLGRQVYGITPFVDYTSEEFNEKFLMKPEFIDFPQNSESTSYQNYDSNFVGQQQDIDWMNTIGPARSQGGCGSCWAFAVVAALEGNYKIFKNDDAIYNFSEQLLVDCDRTNSGCNGGYVHKAYKWIMSNGIVSASEKPYTGRPQLCINDSSNKALNIVSKYDTCTNCSNDQWFGLLRQGPIAVAMDASATGLNMFKPKDLYEPFNFTNCRYLNHAVTAVGLKQIGTETLIVVRNSWGTDWGFNGYFTANVKNSCYLMYSAFKPVVKNHEDFPAPKCNTFYPQCNSTNGGVTKCEGINSAEKELGSTNIMSWDKQDNSMYWFFYDLENCKGRERSFYFSNSCFSSTFNIKSAALGNRDIVEPVGAYCAVFYSDSCAKGKKFTLCNSIPSVQPGEIPSIGTIMMGSNRLSIILYDQENFKGRGVALNSDQTFIRYNTEDLAYFTNFIPQTKSIAIISIFLNN
jgi:hypothetical protein